MSDAFQDVLKREIRNAKGTSAAKAIFVAILDGDLKSLSSVNDVLARPSGEGCSALIEECNDFLKAFGLDEKIGVRGYCSNFLSGEQCWSLNFEFYEDNAKYVFYVNILDMQRENVRPEVTKHTSTSYSFTVASAAVEDAMKKLQVMVEKKAHELALERYAN